MQWSPPKKFTVIISSLLQIVGFVFGLVGTEFLELDLAGYIENLGLGSWSLNMIGLFGILICTVGWALLLLGVFLRGL